MGNLGQGPRLRQVTIATIRLTYLIQAIIERQADVPEGTLIRAVSIPWRAVVRALHMQPDLAYKISPYNWEELVAAAFDEAGYDEVILTPKSGDHGRDVIATRNGVGAIRIIGSVKAYKPGHLVNHDDVRALMGVLSTDLRASKGIITTTSDFAPGIAKDPFIASLIPYRLELMNGPALQTWFDELASFDGR